MKNVQQINQNGTALSQNTQPDLNNVDITAIPLYYNTYTNTISGARKGRPVYTVVTYMSHSNPLNIDTIADQVDRHPTNIFSTYGRSHQVEAF